MHQFSVKHLSRAKFLLICLFGISILFESTSLLAKTYIVNSVKDVHKSSAPVGSLRYAINHAKDGDTINFDLGAATTTIYLCKTLVIKHGFNINGTKSKDGKPTITISRNNKYNCRIFTVDLDSATKQGAVLDSLIISNGHPADGAIPANNGGGIYITKDSKLTIQNCTIQNNHAGNGGIGAIGGSGGGLYNEGQLKITQTTLTKNNSGNGGGNADTSGFGGNGGAIFNAVGATLTIGAIKTKEKTTDSFITENWTGTNGFSTDNHDSGNGGGIFSAGNANIGNVEISKNFTSNVVYPGRGGTGNPGSSGSGGGICIVNGGKTVVKYCNIMSNITGRGGNHNQDHVQPLMHSYGGTGGHGAGIFVGPMTLDQDHSVTIEVNHILSNTAGAGGDNFSVMTPGLDFTAVGGSGGNGGGVFIAKMTGQLTNIIFNQNIVKDNSTGNAGISTFSGTWRHVGPRGLGGGIYSYVPFTDITSNNTITENKLGSGLGGTPADANVYIAKPAKSPDSL